MYFGLVFVFFLGSEVHIQCDVAQCVGGCYEDVCPGDVLTASAIKNPRPGNKVEDGTLPAATTVFVVDPADAPRKKLINLINGFDWISVIASWIDGFMAEVHGH